MRTLCSASTIVLVALSVFAAGCGTATDSNSASSTTSSAAPAPSSSVPTVPQTARERLCDGLSWPRPMPAVVGLIFDKSGDRQTQADLDDTDLAGFGPLTCLDGVRGVGPGGDTVFIDGGFLPDTAASYRITAISPPPGSSIGQRDPVTVTLEPLGLHEPDVYQPCDWVTQSEASAFLGGAPVQAQGGGGVAGAGLIGCGYRSPNHVHLYVTDSLELRANYVVDAAAEFAFRTSDDATVVDGLGIKAACRQKHVLYVLLPGERIYVATGWESGVGCDTLTKFAQASIPRLGSP